MQNNSEEKKMTGPQDIQEQPKQTAKKNDFFVDSANLSEAALEKKHRLENDPSSRKNHMEYMPDMEQIDTGIRDKVMEQMESYDYSRYTARDVRNAPTTNTAQSKTL